MFVAFQEESNLILPTPQPVLHRVSYEKERRIPLHPGKFSPFPHLKGSNPIPLL